MSYQPIRGARPAINQRNASGWLLGFVVLSSVAGPAAIGGWALAAAYLRNGRRARWLVLATITWLGAYLALATPQGALETHFRIWQWLPTWVAYSSSPETHTAVQRQAVYAGMAASWEGFIPLGLPVGLLLGTAFTRKSLQRLPAWSGQAKAHREAQTARQMVRAVEQAGQPPDRRLEVPALGTWLDGDLPWLVVPRVLQLRHPDWSRKMGRKGVPMLSIPERKLWMAKLIVGSPGSGKTTLAKRAAYIKGFLGHQFVFFDAKGSEPNLPEDIAAHYLKGWRAAGHVGDPRMLSYPKEPMNIWKGSPRSIVQKILAVWEFAAEGSGDFFASVAEQALRLAIDVPQQEGLPPLSSKELIRRIQNANILKTLHRNSRQNQAAIDELTRLRHFGMVGPAVRLRSTLNAIGETLDGPRSFEDADCLIITVPAGIMKRDASTVLRVLLEDFELFALERRSFERPGTLWFDEFSALMGGRVVATNLVERLRSSFFEIVLTAQSTAALGKDWADRHRIYGACSGGKFVFQADEPDELVRLIGSEVKVEVSYNMDANGPTDRGTVREGEKFKLDPNRVRYAQPGECFVLCDGAYAHMYVHMTALSLDDYADARALLQVVAPVEDTEPTEPIGGSNGEVAIATRS